METSTDNLILKEEEDYNNREDMDIRFKRQNVSSQISDDSKIWQGNNEKNLEEIKSLKEITFRVNDY